MNFINSESLADVEFTLRWESDEASHEERLFTKVNLWRDILPPGLSEQINGKIPGDRFEASYGKEKKLLPSDPSNEFLIKRNQFNSDTTTPDYGRFYPLGLLRGLPNVFPGNLKPFRVTGVDEKSIKVDLNHPLADYDLHVSAVIHDTINKPYDRGGECSLLMECLADGPGMQVRGNGRPTEFFSEDTFRREDQADDAIFYKEPRLVNHIDDKAIDTITNLYGDFIKPGMDVLDLMSAWRSHVPENSGLNSLVGLGMNAEELKENPQLTDFRVNDLNENPTLPFADNSFDLIINTVSVEYLIHPDEVFTEIARILKPGGKFVVTFSNRWFPPKVINVWPALHEFERMGLVLEYFIRTGKFNHLNTFSSRGWPRPITDKYYPQFRKSDPVYAVWGETIA